MGGIQDRVLGSVIVVPVRKPFGLRSGVSQAGRCGRCPDADSDLLRPDRVGRYISPARQVRDLT